MSNEHESFLNLNQLSEALTKRFGGRKVHPDTIRKRLAMGLPHHIDRTSNRKLYLASEVMAWWVTDSSVAVSF